MYIMPSEIQGSTVKARSLRRHEKGIYLKLTERDNKMKTLIVVDMQFDFTYGPLGTKEARDIIPRVRKKIEEYHKCGDRIIFTRDTHEFNYLETHEGNNLPIPHCIKRTNGWEIVDGIYIPGCLYVNKCTFGWPHWDSMLTDPEIEIVGLCTDICVISNALILRSLYPESDITVDASCCAGTTPWNHRSALSVMKSCQINIINEKEC